jgi:hypothetical protein
MTRFLVRCASVAIAVGCLFVAAGKTLADDDDERDAQSKNMTLVGFNDLQSRSTYQPVVHKQRIKGSDRYIAYTGHHGLGTNPKTGEPLPSINPLTGQKEPNGTSIVDVTDPRRPKYLFHLPVGTTGNGGAQMVRVCNIGGTEYMLRSYASSAHEIWDVTDPSNPKDVRTVRNGNAVTVDKGEKVVPLSGTHKSWWECDTGIAYIVGRRVSDTVKGKENDFTVSWRPGNHIMIYDLSNPAHPKFIRDWALDGQQPGSELPPHFDAAPAIHGPISTGAHGRVYFAYGVGENGVMQVADRDALLSTSANDFKSAELGRWIMQPDNGGHTSWPLGKITVPDFTTDTGNDVGNVRDVVVVVSESTQHFCAEMRHTTTMVDVTNEGRPQSLSTFLVPASSGAFCDRGGRFGPHATNEEFGAPFYQKLIFVSYFNAGVRAVDVRDPYNPKEVAFYIPSTTPATDYRCGTYKGVPNICRQVVQTNNVATDDRGFVYIVDRANTGMHILRLTGSAARIAGLRSDD